MSISYFATSLPKFDERRGRRQTEEKAFLLAENVLK